MLAFVTRRWFLILLIAGVTFSLLAPGLSGALTGRLEPRLVIAVALFLMGWTMPSRSLAREIIRPGASLWAVAVSYGLVPLAAWLLAQSLPGHFAVGLLIIASVPSTLAAGVLWTRMAGGNEATALLVTVVTTATSWLVTPAWLALTTGRVVAFDRTEMMLDLLLTLVLPVGLGQAARFFGPLGTVANRGKGIIGAVAQLFILSIILKASAKAGEYVQQPSVGTDAGELAGILIAAVGLHLAALFAGFYSGGLWHFDRPSRLAIAFSGSQKTLPVSLLLFESYYDERFPLAVVPIIIYHVGQLILDTFVVEAFIRSKRAVSEEGPELDAG